MIDRTTIRRHRDSGLVAVLCLVSTFALLTVLSCSGTSVRPPTCEQLGNLYGRSAEVVRDGGRIDDVAVYIDASVPMRNYVRMDVSSPTTLYSELLEFLGSNPWNAQSVHYLMFGEGAPRPIEGGRHTLSRPANDRSFYDQKWTHLGELVDNINRTLSAGDRTLRVVVTDMVQANEPSVDDPSQSNWAYVANHIRESLKRGGWQLLGFRSVYQGRHYPESGTAPFEVSTPVERPFYVLIFGPNEDAVDKGAEALLDGEGTLRWRSSCRRFQPKSQMVQVRCLQSQTPDYVDEQHGVRNPIMLREEVCDGVVSLDWVGIENQKALCSVMSLFLLSTGNPSESFINIQDPTLQIAVDCFGWMGVGEEGKPISSESLAPECQISPPRRHPADSITDLYQRRYWVDFHLKPSSGMRASAYYIYKLSVAADPSRLRLPAWVSEWSTDDDCNPAMIGRTLNLKQILGSVVRAMSADEPLYTGFFVVLGR